MEKKGNKTVDRIVILRSAVLGDFIISSPAINYIREKHPYAKICLLTIQSAHKKDRNAVKVYETNKTQPWLDFLDTNVVDEIIPMQSISFSYLYREIRPLINRINPTKCYVLTDPLVKYKGNIAKMLLMKFLGARCPVYGWKDFVFFEKERCDVDANCRCINHTLSCFESVLEDPSINDTEIVVKFPIKVSPEGKEKAKKTWDELSLGSKKVIVVSPGGIKSHKIWPINNYIEVIKYLLKEEHTEILLTGTKKDENVAQTIVDSIDCDRIHNLVAKTSLQHLAGILSKADLLIGNDGGTMHIGDAVGATVVAIMPGLELHNSVEPWHNMKNSLRFNVECAPCYNFDYCTNTTYQCMNGITVESVIGAIEKSSLNKRDYNRVKIYVERNGKRINLKIGEIDNI